MSENKKTRYSFKLLILGSALMFQGVSYAFIAMGVPAILRDMNEDLTTITLYSLLFLPWAGRILYAPFLDRLYCKRFGKRRTWLLITLPMTMILLVFTAVFIPAKSSPALMAVLFLINLFLSVNDTVVGAYSSDILENDEMPWAGTIRLGANYVGMILGGGLLLSHYQALGWENMFYLLAGLSLLVGLPVLFHKEIAPVHETIRKGANEKPSMFRFVRSPGIGWFIVVEVLFVTSLYTGSQIYPPFLIDLGLANKDIGRIFMYWGYPLGFVAAVAAGWALRKFSPYLVLPLSMAVEACVQLYAYCLAGTSAVTHTHAVILMSLEMALGSFAGVAFYTLLMIYCIGPQAATNIGVLSSIANITPMLFPPVLGLIADAHGYQAMYAVMAGTSVLFLLVVTIIFRTCLPDSHKSKHFGVSDISPEPASASLD